MIDRVICKTCKAILAVFAPATSALTVRSVVPKLVRDITQIKVAIMSYYPQYSAVVGHSMDEDCGFFSTLPLEESYITPSLEPLG